MIRLTRRLIRFVGWLFTPFIAWAVAFMGGWLGARLAADVESARAGMTYVVVGSLLGALVGGGTWALSLRWSSRQAVMWARKHHLVTGPLTEEMKARRRSKSGEAPLDPSP